MRLTVAGSTCTPEIVDGTARLRDRVPVNIASQSPRPPPAPPLPTRADPAGSPGERPVDPPNGPPEDTTAGRGAGPPGGQETA